MYTPNMTGKDWIDQSANVTQQLVAVVNQGKLLYDKWYALTYGMGGAANISQQLPQLSPMNVADITTLTYALSMMNDVYNCINNGNVSQSNRMGYFEPLL